MENVISRGEVAALPNLVKGVRGVIAEQVQQLSGCFRDALEYEREKIFKGEPTVEDEKEFLTVVKELHGAIELAARFAPRVHAEELEWMTRRLKMSIDSLENPMTEKEADAFLAKHFPDER
jgi:hypothetical protein